MDLLQLIPRSALASPALPVRLSIRIVVFMESCFSRTYALVTVRCWRTILTRLRRWRTIRSRPLNTSFLLGAKNVDVSKQHRMPDTDNVPLECDLTADDVGEPPHNPNYDFSDFGARDVSAFCLALFKFAVV